MRYNHPLGDWLHRAPYRDGANEDARGCNARQGRSDDLNAYEQLEAIRDQLEENGANERSIELVEKFLKRAESERYSATSVPQIMMLRHLLKQREALDNFEIYNDLQELMGEIEGRRASRDEDAAPAAYEEEHRPRPKSYYKAQREKERDK
jgi:hypothetical protein